MNQQKQNGNIIAIITMFFLFAMISFVTNLAAPFGTIWKNQYAGANTLGMMGNMMNFLAYLFMGIPSGNMLVKIGYKKTALIAMAVGFIGLFIQYISSLFGADIDVFNLGEYAIKMNFIIYLLGAFVCGFCVCMLNTVVNPMLNLLGGGGNKGNQLIQAGGALNSLSGTLTPLFVGALIGSVTPQTAMSDVAPLLFIAMGVFVSAFIALSFIAIPEPHLRKAGHEKEKFSHSPWNFRHTVLGVIGIFVYVGIDFNTPKTIAPDVANFENEQIKFGNGFDHNWVLNTKGDINQLAAKLTSPTSGITLEVYTNEPGIQVYTGNFLDGTVKGKKGITYPQRASVCLETQHYPDSPNKSQWPSVILEPGQTYHSQCIFKFGVEK